MIPKQVVDFLLEHQTAERKIYLNSTNRLWLSSTTDFNASCILEL